jgi:hypothetical protein
VAVGSNGQRALAVGNLKIGGLSQQLGGPVDHPVTSTFKTIGLVDQTKSKQALILLLFLFYFRIVVIGHLQ